MKKLEKVEFMSEALSVSERMGGEFGETKQGLKRWSYEGILHKTRIDEEMKTETESNLPWIV